jgi:hypothetical protein
MVIPASTINNVIIEETTAAILGGFKNVVRSGFWSKYEEAFLKSKATHIPAHQAYDEGLLTTPPAPIVYPSGVKILKF